MEAPTIQKQLAPPTKSLPQKMTIVPSPASFCKFKIYQVLPYLKGANYLPFFILNKFRKACYDNKLLMFPPSSPKHSHRQKQHGSFIVMQQGQMLGLVSAHLTST